MTDLERQLHDALSEVMDWIDNWAPTFREDEEWLATEQKVTDALIAFLPPQPPASSPDG